MLTGDNQRTAQRVTQQLGIDDVRAGLKPDDKVKAIEELIKINPTLMVASSKTFIFIGEKLFLRNIKPEK